MNRNVSFSSIKIALTALALSCLAFAGAPALAQSAPAKVPEFKLPAGMHPNSIGAQSLRAEHDRKVAAAQAQAAAPSCAKKPCVPVVGRTADGKYPVYALEGELEDFNYFSPKTNTQWSADAVVYRLAFADEADRKAGRIKCEVVCKNPAGQIIGANPQRKWMVK